MSTPMIQISNLMKSYELGGDTVHALNDVSLDIDKGEFLAAAIFKIKPSRNYYS